MWYHIVFLSWQKKQTSSYQNRFPPKAGTKCSRFQHHKSIIKELDFPIYKTTFWTYSTFVRLFGLFGFNLWTYSTLKSDSHLPKKYIYLFQWWPFKNDEKCFYFILKALFILKILNFMSWRFGHLEKTAWLER